MYEYTDEISAWIPKSKRADNIKAVGMLYSIYLNNRIGLAINGDWKVAVVNSFINLYNKTSEWNTYFADFSKKLLDFFKSDYYAASRYWFANNSASTTKLKKQPTRLSMMTMFDIYCKNKEIKNPKHSLQDVYRTYLESGMSEKEKRVKSKIN